MRWVWERGSPVRDEDGRVVRVAGIAEDVTDRKRDEQALRDLADASETPAAPIDPDGTLHKVAALAVPTFADWCAVDVAEADGAVRRVAAVHADPDKSQLAPDPLPRSGRPELVPDLTDEMAAEGAPDAERRASAAARADDGHDGPLEGARPGGRVGVVRLDRGRPAVRPGDLAHAEELARRAGVAVENARCTPRSARRTGGRTSSWRRSPTSCATRSPRSATPCRS